MVSEDFYMDRCDFSSVIKIIDKYIIEESGINQVDLLNKLFEYLSASRRGYHVPSFAL